MAVETQKLLAIKAKGVDLKKKLRAHAARNHDNYENFIDLIEEAENDGISTILGPHNLTGNARLDASIRAYIKKLGVEFIHQPRPMDAGINDGWGDDEEEEED